ncbi:MAG: hypothetical protein ACSHYB_11385 [Roseibacillus sp.]
MSSRHHIESCEGFAIHTLSNDKVSLSLAPQLGGRIVSIRDKEADREWLDGWDPSSERRLSQPTDLNVYDTSNGAGLDECLPTVLPCQRDGINFSDHGELWKTNPTFEYGNEHLTCSWQLSSLPLTFQRTIWLEGNTLHLDYCLENLIPTPTPFLWAWHPLFKLERGDRLLVDSSLSQCANPEGEIFPWPSPKDGQDLSTANTGTANPPAAKVFLGPLDAGKATLQGKKSQLSLTWPAKYFPWAGIWITRGAWKGLHHWAVEPTNAPVDHLSKVTKNSLGQLEGHESRNWTIEIKLSSRI